jgi:hypothetical protein
MSLNARALACDLPQQHRRDRTLAIAVTLALIAPVGTIIGCESAPGDEPEQGAVIGGVAGGLAGAALGGEDNWLQGTIIGAVLGAGGGYLIGSELDKRSEEEGREAARRARENPATADAAREARTADIDNNGFVTVDEVIAMEQAGLSDDEMIGKLRDTGQVFSLGDAEKQQLAQGGVSETVIDRMPELNREKFQPEEDDSGRLSDPQG